MQNTNPALLLIAHGSRHAEANADLHWLALELEKDGRYHIVIPSYLELAEPNIPAGAKQCVESGAKHIILVPYFLSAGVHVKRDLENYRNELSLTHPGVTFTLADPLGRHPLLIDVVRERIRSSVGKESSNHRGTEGTEKAMKSEEKRTEI